VNQLAALSGCMDYNDKTEDMNHYQKKDAPQKKPSGPQTHCPAGGNLSFGPDKKGVSQDHWIFDVAKSKCIALLASRKTNFESNDSEHHLLILHHYPTQLLAQILDILLSLERCVYHCCNFILTVSTSLNIC